MTFIEDQIRQAARKFLENDEVSCVIGYERDKRRRARPAFIESVEDVDRLIWGSDCNINLASYLHERKHSPGKNQPIPKTAVVLRPCDIRSINMLINEQQIIRENIRIIGVSCEGSEINGQQRADCEFCQERIPSTFDVLIESEAPIVIPDSVELYNDIEEMDKWTPEERLAFWTAEFDRCIRCYACRQACPGCYCFECVSEQLDPHWTSIAIEVPEKMFFHVMRAYHLAGRCAACGACEAVCPMDIPLGKLNRKISKEILGLFDYRPGMDVDANPPLVCFNPNERLNT